MRRIARAAYGPYVERIGRPPAPMTADYDAIACSGHARVVDRADVVLGFCVVLEEPDHVLLENLAVDPSEQGQGLGRLLVRVAEERARELGLARVRLYTNEAMTENLLLYPRLGYRETHRALRDGFSRVFFAKAIDPDGPGPDLG